MLSAQEIVLFLLFLLLLIIKTKLVTLAILALRSHPHSCPHIPQATPCSPRHASAQQVTEVTGDRALVAGTNTLCGAIATLWRGIQKLIKGARCSIVEAIEAATLHPAQVGSTHDRYWP